VLHRPAVTETTSPPQRFFAAFERGAYTRQRLMGERAKDLLTEDVDGSRTLNMNTHPVHKRELIVKRHVA